MPITPVSSTADSAAATPSEDHVSDHVLLSRFLDRQEETAFAELVKRYGEMVFATAVRVLRDRHAAEDVLQATFLVLARDGRKLRRQAALAAWLHGVALRLAKKALLRRKKGRPWEVFMEPVVEDPLLDEMHEVFEQQLLDEELEKLPENYRLPLVLHFLQGKTYEETAEALGTTVGAIEGRMKRGKRELQLRLMRRGVEMTAVMAAITWSQSAAQAAVQPEVMSTVVQGGMAMLQGSSFAPACSSEAVHLAAKETAMFTAGKVAVTTVGLALASVMGWVSHAGMNEGRGAGAPSSAQQGELSDLTLAQVSEGAATPVDAGAGSGAAGPIGSGESGPGEDSGFGYSGTAGTGGAFTRNEKGTAGGFSGVPGAGSPGAGLMSDMAGMGAGPGVIPVSRNQRATEEKIEQELAKLTNFQFTGSALKEVLDYVTSYHKIPIRIDQQSIEDLGVAIETEVDLQVEGVSVESGLNMLLENVGGVELTFVIRNETLLITTAEKAESILETRVYDVRALEQKDPNLLINAIQGGTNARWFEIEGEGGTISPLSGQLVIKQTQRGHKEVEELLNNLLKNLQSGSGEIPEWPAREPVVPPAGLMGGSGGGMGGMMGGGF